ncbi:hypothetical protein BN6_55270 [Saccharothrix espanaensis DSM 44229]|uniref:Uncharacterized protein n=1 Tax=Saccharothrix espanaensis (strain ATCC 51144 / DSM 44229 / JCM 9112 / NBRC 15066 / NRRL 15764) TaxID=1179773 RepID=K0K399_SACES|nr:hypothetical protein BN6_55270 [Saccharothrix espanaensis DSM 44229]
MLSTRSNGVRAVGAVSVPRFRRPLRPHRPLSRSIPDTVRGSRRDRPAGLGEPRARRTGTYGVYLTFSSGDGTWKRVERFLDRPHQRRRIESRLG